MKSIGLRAGKAEDRMTHGMKIISHSLEQLWCIRGAVHLYFVTCHEIPGIFNGAHKLSKLLQRLGCNINVRVKGIRPLVRYLVKLCF